MSVPGRKSRLIGPLERPRLLIADALEILPIYSGEDEPDCFVATTFLHRNVGWRGTPWGISPALLNS